MLTSWEVSIVTGGWCGWLGVIGAGNIEKTII